MIVDFSRAASSSKGHAPLVFSCFVSLSDAFKYFLKDTSSSACDCYLQMGKSHSGCPAFPGTGASRVPTVVLHTRPCGSRLHPRRSPGKGPERLSRSTEDAAGCKPRTLGSDVWHGRRWAPSPPPSDGPSLPLQLSLFWRPDQASRCLHPGPQEPTRAPQRPRGHGPGSPLSGAVAGAAVSVRMKGGIEGWAPRRLAPRQPHNAGFVQPAGLS